MGIGSLVLIKDSTKHRANWKIGYIVEAIVGKDGVTKGYKILTGNGYIVERPFQLICNLEIGGANDECRPVSGNTEHSGHPTESTLQHKSRRERQVSQTARNRLVGVIAHEDEED